MIIVKLIGGLGNQMFQYAFGLSVAAKLKCQLKLDVTDLTNHSAEKNYTQRVFELNIFNGDAHIASESDLAAYDTLKGSGISLLAKRVQRRISGTRYYHEKQHTIYDPAVFDIGRNTYFEGYWQNQKYFSPWARLIRQHFRFNHSPNRVNTELINQMQGITSVSVHVRRGDYVTNAQANEFHGVCSISYYKKAVEFLQQRVGPIRLFVFSDEPDWVKANMHFTAPVTYVCHNQGKSSYEDMRLMSLCNHNVVANSSFSWWGAWLNNSPDKIIIAPSQWYQNMPGNITDLVPAEWIRI